MAVRTPGADEIREIAADFGMTLSAADADSYRGLLEASHAFETSFHWKKL